MDGSGNQRAIPSLPSGERARVRGQLGKRRTRTAAARDLARCLRKNSTDTEKRLWRLLRDRRFAEFKFRRQYPCGIYFLDFCCALAKLAVELDGGGHGFPDQRAKDEKRNQFLAGQGIKVLRFWNHQLRGELEAVRFDPSPLPRWGAREKTAAHGCECPNDPPAPAVRHILSSTRGEDQGEGVPCDE